MRLGDLSDQEAWDDFVQRYVPKIYGWCRRYKLQEADASDVTQEVLGKLVTAMKKFEYDPARGSFRGWLKTVTHNAVRDFANNMKKHRGSGDTQVMSALAAAAAPEALDDLTREIESQTELEILREAEARVILRVKNNTWLAYCLTANENLTAPQAAKQLNIDVAQIYVSKSRVIKMLRSEVAKLSE
jgi:RNA polymerase sigma factor (sigma-70 family)